MLTQETKRKIDSARDILVGKVPDPKAQVEQITTALIYKFMDDMDKENEEVGLKAQFFVGDWKKFSWTKLLDNKLSGPERLDLYVQAITNMSKNPHIPQLFRDIFKGAFLPYNDPRTLSLFLKEINEFNYEHSENLGNAFEYLLSILGSQGDAGQFRTPRHIIDFMVEIVDPKKNETVLDPACGTAGFLISAYKHILKNNQEKPLTPDEKKKMMSNFVGYDISPDMVKLALVNMYLHGFPNPKIYEYDTLSSENRWDETFDVIMANPPFMTPKGGIRPHKRFSIQANRSEVLFVDYIVNHLNLKGRAGIIVPEGIIFQSANAYKSLRKNLVEDGLVAVISLPSGVFNPYAGVKTSILLFDNDTAKIADNLLFIKINNDGFDLGAQRREIDKNDLPVALEIIKKYHETLSDENFTEAEKGLAQVVARRKIAESGDYNLTGERYREVETFTNQKWPMVELGEVAEYINGFAFKPSDWHQTGTPIVRIQNLTASSKKINTTERKDIPDKYLIKNGDLLISWSATIGFYIWRGGSAYLNQHIFKVKTKDKILKKYLYFLGNEIIEEIKKKVHGNTMTHITKGMFNSIKIPLPPLSVQKEIVEKIEVKQKAINSAKEVIKNLERERRHFDESLRGIEGIEWVELGEVAEIQRGGSPRPINDYITNDSDGVNWIKIGDAKEGSKYITKTSEKITKEGAKKSRLVKEGDFILSNSMSFGRPYILKTKGCIHDGWLLLSEMNSNINKDYLYYILFSEDIKKQFEMVATGGVVKNLNSDLVRKTKIPLPSLEVQQKLVAEAEEEQKIIDANKKLIEIMEGKIEKVLEEI